MTMKTYVDFPVGTVFNTGGTTITEAHVVGFAGLTGDFYRIHMDENFCKSTEFGTRIAHGPLVYGVALGQIYQARLFSELALALLGVDGMRHLVPCYIGTTIYTRVTITESRPTSAGGRAVVKAKLEVHDPEETCLMECEIAMLTHTPDSVRAQP
jgi:acyl dehydratase